MYNTSVIEENANRNIPSDIHYMFIDTETTGVPTNNYQNWDQCRLIQLGFVVKDKQFETVSEYCLTVQLDGTNGTTEESYQIHGISDESRLNATPSREVCETFMDIAERCDVLISHGNAFDFGVIFRECLLNDIDISRLVGKTVVNTKQSEHYRGFRENLQQTVLRINPNWQIHSKVLSNDNQTNNNHAHNALYDAYLCAELYRQSHHPLMGRPMQDLIEFLNFRKYYAGISDLRRSIENINIPVNNNVKRSNDFAISERLRNHINMEREMEYQSSDNSEEINGTSEREEESVYESDESSFIPKEETESEDYDEHLSVRPEYSTSQFSDDCLSMDSPIFGPITDDYLRFLCKKYIISHHAPEDWDNQ